MRGCREEAELPERERDDEEGKNRRWPSLRSKMSNEQRYRQRQIGTGRFWAPTGCCEVASGGLGVLLADQGPACFSVVAGPALHAAELRYPYLQRPCC